MNVSVRIRKWGNSLGVLIPKDVAEKCHVTQGDNVFVDIQKKDDVLKELFGSLRFIKPTRKIIRELQGELEGKLM